MTCIAFDVVLITDESTFGLWRRLRRECTGRFRLRGWARLLGLPGLRKRFHIEFEVANDARAVLGSNVKVLPAVA